MRIKLYRDYRGVLTEEVFYTSGVRDVPKEHAATLVSSGRAEYVKEKPAPKHKKRPYKKRKVAK